MGLNPGLLCVSHVSFRGTQTPLMDKCCSWYRENDATHLPPETVKIITGMHRISLKKRIPLPFFNTYLWEQRTSPAVPFLRWHRFCRAQAGALCRLHPVLGQRKALRGTSQSAKQERDPRLLVTDLSSNHSITLFYVLFYCT